MSDVKIPLPKFLKALTSNDVPISKAMTFAAKIYKEYNTPAQLALLTELKLTAVGIDSKDDRKLVIAALQKSGYVPKEPPRKKTEKVQPLENNAGPSTTPASVPSAMQAVTTPRKKRKRASDDNELLPDGSTDEAAQFGSLDFLEVLDEEILMTKSAVINRAPLMTAWAVIVAERVGFQREEALSIASVYTEMNAITKGVSLGIYKPGKQKEIETFIDGSQPYVDIIGRRPLYQTQSKQWRALSNGRPVEPSVAFSYISRSFRQTAPFIFGALKLLANSYSAEELKAKAWSLYADFRPSVEKWGARADVKCADILRLRPRIAKESLSSNLDFRPDPAPTTKANLSEDRSMNQSLNESVRLF